jgi:PEGA domain-containing protein
MYARMKEPKSRAARVALVAGLLASGCASVASPGPDMVPVSSHPDGATVSLDGIPVGRTPCTVAFQRAGEGILRFERDGYETLVLDQDKVMNGWFVGNLLWGSLMIVAVPVDLAMSNQGKYSTNPVFVELRPAGSPTQ